MKRTVNQEIINNDMMRYKANKLPANLALLGIVFNCLYFCLLYGFRGSFFSMWEIGISVIVTLFSLLLAFLASQGIRGYNKKYTITLLVLAAIQIIRIFGLPLQALNYDVEKGVAEALVTRYFGIDMESAACFTLLVVYLVASAACYVVAAIIGYINCTKLEKFNAQLASGEVNVDETLKAMDIEDTQNALKAQSAVQNSEEVK